MNREEFTKIGKESGVDEQIEYVNEQLKLGLSREKIANNVGYSRASFNRKALRNGYNFDEVFHQYVKVIPSNEGVVPMKNTKATPSNEGVIPVADDTDMDKVIPSNTEVMTKKKSKKDVQDIIKQILDEEYPELKEMIEWYKNKNNINTRSEFDLENERLQGPIINKSFKSYANVLDQFVQFCFDKKETQKDLLALAMLEFMERYR